MARIVKRTQTGPMKLEAAGQTLWVCHCGLSHKLPYCDGHHKLARTEEPGKLYQYDSADTRKEIPDTFGDISTF